MVGRYYTPPELVRLLVERTLRHIGGDPLAVRVCDPSMGAGHMLAGAVDWLAARVPGDRETARRLVLERCITGVDIDPAAVEAARVALPGARLECADALFFDWSELGPFDAVVGNPPWSRVKHQPDAAALARRLRARFPRLTRGDLNLYSPFVELAEGLVRPGGVVGLLVPSGFAADKGTSAYFRDLAGSGRLAALLDFENRRGFFPDVHPSFKFAAIVFGGVERRFAETECAAWIRDVGALDVFTMLSDDFAAVNPNTGTAPLFRTRRDAEVTLDIYRRLPVLVDRRVEPPRRAWPVRYVRMLDMTNDSALFRREPTLTTLPLYEGKMVQAYDHRAASVAVDPSRPYRPSRPVPTILAQHADPTFQPRPQFHVERGDVERVPGIEWALCFKEITAPTNARTTIAAIAPYAAFGNKVPLLLPAGDLAEYRRLAPLLLAMLNSLAFDYVARQKIHGQTLNLFVLEQLPVVPPEAFDGALGDAVRADVLGLTYTSHDLAPFARDLGYDGPPFAWDVDDRRRRRARLDAVFLRLYGLSPGEIAHLLATFPLVPREDRNLVAHYALVADAVLF